MGDKIWVLIFAHTVFDWLLQRKKTAYGKLSSPAIRFNHATFYALGVSIVYCLVCGVEL
jgi:hypothetical protein